MNARDPAIPGRPRYMQTPITFRSDRAAERLKLLTSTGRSQAAVIEDALERVPIPAGGDRATIRAEIDAILASVPRRRYPNMAEIDAEMYDDEGLPR